MLPLSLCSTMLLSCLSGLYKRQIIDYYRCPWLSQRCGKRVPFAEDKMQFRHRSPWAWSRSYVKAFSLKTSTGGTGWNYSSFKWAVASKTLHFHDSNIPQQWLTWQDNNKGAIMTCKPWWNLNTLIYLKVSQQASNLTFSQKPGNYFTLRWEITTDTLPLY